MKTIITRKQYLFLFSFFLLLLLACGQSPEDARRELGQMNIEYSEASFLKCAERGDVLAVKLFLASGIDPNIKGNDGMTPLLIAAREGRENVISLLLQKGADLNAREIENGFNAILFAAGSGNLNAVNLLLSKGANLTDVSKTGHTLLMRAVLIGNNVELIKYLIGKGVDVNAKDIDGDTALLKSMNLFSRNIDIVKLLLGSGVDVNATNKNGNTALIEVTALISDKSNDIIELLLKSGAKVNAANNKGSTALHEGVGHLIVGLPYRIQSVDILLKYGANPNIENNNGETPMGLLGVFQREINLKYEFKQMVNNLIDKLKKAAIASPLDLTVQDILKIKYGVIEICKVGKKNIWGDKIVQFNNKRVLTITNQFVHFGKYIKDFDDDIVLIYERSEGSRFYEEMYYLLTIRKDKSFTVSKKFGNGESYKDIIIRDDNIFIIFPAYKLFERKSEKWVYKNSKLEKVK